MKIWKFLKVFLIIVIVLGSVGGTSYFFFKTFHKEQNAYASINGFVYGTNLEDFSREISTIDKTGGARFTLIENVNDEMQEIIKTLNVYLINASEKSVNNSAINKQIKSAYSQMEHVRNLLEEYRIKCKSSSFNKTVGANDLYVGLSNYLVRVANLISTVNVELKRVVVNYAVDLKFLMIDVYANSCAYAFGNLDRTLSLTNLSTKGSANLTIVRNNFDINNGYCNINSANGSFSKLNNNFIEAYLLCNTKDFAINLSENVNKITSLSVATTNEEKATWHYKEMFDI